MSVEDFTTGLDVAIDIYDPQDGSLTRVMGITSFDAKPITKMLEHHGLEADDRYGTIYLGWDLAMEYTREDGVLDAYFAAREARYRSGLPVQTVTITQTIVEQTGGVSQFRFERVSLNQDEAGTYTRDEKVSGKISGKAGNRVRV